MSWLLTTRLGRALAGLGALIVAVLIGIATGWHRRGDREALRDARDEAETNRRIRNADVSRGDAADDDDWLRRRAKPGRRLRRN